ncbi:FtsQ-type POTRA domain-containing protein [Nocardioides marmoriginsengisoli]|uniref:Cell division protein FtsQ n=1 Tax=Nocardioides marmoriginsengisoli TaxID=661483 RepID=A0A3N0CNF9_9ACTN|nr:FtsQ-type POTRA domain-containing protein [Nocardioides marmoriginsengisoli]RNL64998.1 FtsQ-type POTRA domain-containing protein [Nocardioides marmoriginsengisoli]
MTMADEEVEPTDVTVMVAGPDFARRRLRARLRRWRPFLITGLVVVLVATAVWLIWFSSVVTVRDVEVTGNSAVGTARIERVAQVPLDRQLVRVDLGAIQARVEAIPAIRTVAVSRSWPHGIKIEVTERVPIAVVSRGTGLQAVDDDGVLFGSYARPPADLPLVRTDPNVKAAALAEAARVIRSLRSDIAASVEDVDVASIDKISLRLTGGITVVWGSADSSAAKAEVLAVLLRTAKKDRGPNGGISEIDVSVPGRPTTR